MSELPQVLVGPQPPPTIVTLVFSMVTLFAFTSISPVTFRPLITVPGV